MVDWAWIADHVDEIAVKTVQHVYLTAISVAVGFVIAFGLAVWSIRRRSVYGPLIAFTGILYTIPSLFLFPVLVPITGLSVLTAVIPLVLYTLLIFLRNMVAGFDGVPRDVLEAADGMGYTRWHRFQLVEIPLAIPLIVAGVRLATVSTIGLVTISGILGDAFGGLGFFIFEGLRRRFSTEIFAGALVTIILAVAVDVLLVLLQRRLTPWTRQRTRAAGATASATA
ncbi:MAG TPA: ABC transporter permease [Candidatus Limnocylindrales bacterium]|nr:ABC transporter permease [Candidatus Limnocylindrales bacterium]